MMREANKGRCAWPAGKNEFQVSRFSVSSNQAERKCLFLECAGMTVLWNWQTCLPVGKRRHVAALQIRPLLAEKEFCRSPPRGVIALTAKRRVHIHKSQWRF